MHCGNLVCDTDLPNQRADDARRRGKRVRRICEALPGFAEGNGRLLLFVGYGLSLGNEYLLRPGNQIKRLNAMSVDDEKRFLRLYCHRHPLAQYGEATLKLSVPAVEIR